MPLHDNAPAQRLPAAPMGGSCPYLSPASGADERPGSIDLTRRCLHTAPPSSVSAQHQAVFCLSSGYPACSRFAFAAPRPATVALRPLALMLGVVVAAA